MIDCVHGVPHIRGVAIFADVAGLHVNRAFTRRIRAVMTACAVASDVHVVEVGRQPSGRRMTVVAVVAAVDVSRMFAGRRHAIVTGATGTDDLGVIDGEHGRPDIRRMAVLTDIAGLHVICRFACGVHSVVTAKAVARDVHVIEVGGQPASRRMAIVAVIATRNVCRVLAGRRNPVMTRAAGTNHLRMIDGIGRGPHIGVVAVLANDGRLNMRRTLARCIDTVVAVGAVACDVGVIESGWNPAGG